MGSVVDAKFSALRTQGRTGTISDMTLQWLQANGATAKSIPDAWDQMIDVQMVAPSSGNRNDDWYTLLGEKGYSGALADRELAFWEAGGTFI